MASDRPVITYHALVNLTKGLSIPRLSAINGVRVDHFSAFWMQTAVNKGRITAVCIQNAEKLPTPEEKRRGERADRARQRRANPQRPGLAEARPGSCAAEPWSALGGGARLPDTAGEPRAVCRQRSLPVICQCW